MKLLTFLGTGKYQKTTYVWRDQEEATSYAPVASTRFLQPTALTVFLTTEAREQIYPDFRQALPEDLPVDPREGLPLGRTEDELWSIFEMVVNAVEPGDEVAFDITHGLRSFPFVALLVAAYLRSAFAVNIRHVLYGAYEVRDTSVEPNRTPLFDLSPMLNLLNWATATDRFRRTGDARYFARLLKEQQKSLAGWARETGEDMDTVGHVGKFATALTRVSQSLALIRPYQAMEHVAGLRQRAENALPALSRAGATLPFQKLMDSVLEAFDQIGRPTPGEDLREDLVTLREMIGWYEEREHWVQAISLLREWVVSWVMVQLGMENLTRLADRQRIEKVINSEAEGFLQAKRGKTEFASLFLKEVPELDNMLGLWKALTKTRNDALHAAMRDQPLTPKKLIDQIRNHIKAVKKLPV